ncbi:hypothetical protein A3F65_00975 [Candidatus Saccharibacteria bacterium RIFCSPHIGHO2_12_FULL_47_16b]|nr:MAG: hypothetical protein A3F65_00975 [Candidatus Saccharibacteria bacterium RIFCSPHIGHO2_12_FULL_47_16b]OGL40045.1 MAG: hypothetical protein A3J32_02880 [Candidatus Saccharibacteria bacterium RIFCSPLOWO2_02_FULL_46_7]
MKLTKNKLAGAFALSTAVVWTLCSALVAIWPDFAYKVTKWWLHGMNIDSLGEFSLSWDNYLTGGLTLVISLWVIGYVLGWSLELFSKSSK